MSTVSKYFVRNVWSLGMNDRFTHITPVVSVSLVIVRQSKVIREDYEKAETIFIYN